MSSSGRVKFKQKEVLVESTNVGCRTRAHRGMSMLSEELFRAPLLIITCKKGQTHEGGVGKGAKEGRGIARGVQGVFFSSLFTFVLALFLLHAKERRNREVCSLQAYPG